MQFVYGVRVTGGFEPVCYQFAQWVVGTLAAVRRKYASSTDGSEITTASRSGSPAGSLKHSALLYLREGYEHECFSPSSNSRRKFREIKDDHEH